MPKVSDPYERQHIVNLAKYGKLIDEIFKTATQEAAQIGALIGISGFDTSRLFSFRDYPLTQKRVQSLLARLANSVEVAIVNGVDTEWTLANNKNNALSRRVFGDNVGRLTQAQYRRYFSTNDDARQAFLQRKEQGLNLSERVWRYAQGFKNDIELGLDVGIRNGLDADAMSRELRQFLRYPDKLFRRVRDEHGNLVLSKRAADFHPGQGVYRSSYKNARRLAVTETNMAYRTADYERIQQLDFVVGIEVCLSNNHPIHDICDDLCGRYPKDFKFTGWHPHCRCYVVQILKTEKELMEETRAILNGEEPTKDSVNRIDDVPHRFKDWIKDNKERAKRSMSVPYFISDNKKYLPKGYENLYALKTPYETYAEYEAAMRYNKKHADFTPEILKNIRELDQTLPVMQGKIMNFTEADQLKGNPHYSDHDAAKEGYLVNCQTCTMTYELRRRGFPVEALPNKNNEFYDIWCPKNNLTWDDRFLNPDGSRPIKKRPLTLSDTITAKVGFIENSTKETGRYELYLKWKPVNGEDRGAHVMIVERQKDGNLLWFDPQSGVHGSSKTFNGFIKSAVPIEISVLRIDDKIINPKFSERLKKASK